MQGGSPGASNRHIMQGSSSGAANGIILQGSSSSAANKNINEGSSSGNTNRVMLQGGSSGVFKKPEANVLHIEVVPGEECAKLPAMFSKQFIHIVSHHVTFTDPNKNILNMSVCKDAKNAFFCDGWKFFCNYYGLFQLAWVHMVYDGGRRFFIRIFTSKAKEVAYPPIPESLAPPVRQKPMQTYTQPTVATARVTGPSTMPLPIPVRKLIDYSKFHAKLVKWVKFSELVGDTMTIPLEWAYEALPVKDGEVTIMDEYGKKWVVYLKHDIHIPGICGLTKGWQLFAAAKGLKQDQQIKFGVMEKNANILYNH